MSLNKQDVNINFSQGLDTKTDPWQVSTGKFLSLSNTIFDKGGRLTKRNGYGALSTLPDDTTKYITTFNGNLTAIGNHLQAYSSSTNSWVDKGPLQSLDLSTTAMVRNNTSQSQSDIVVASNGLACVVYTDQDTANLANSVYKYVVMDSVTGQNIIEPTELTDADATYGTPRVFLLGNYFIIVYTTQPAGYHIAYIAISINDPTVVTSPLDIATSYIPSTTLNFDGVVTNDRLFIAYNTTAGGQSVRVTYLTPTLGNPVTAATFVGEIATMFSLTADNSTASNPIVYVSYYDLASTVGKVLAIDQNLNTILAPTSFISSGTILNLASVAQSGVFTSYYEVSNAYSYDASIKTNYIKTNTVTQAGVVGTASTLVRSVGLASKAFLYNGVSYFLTIYNSSFQATYFLVNGSGKVISILASQNAGEYLTKGLPNVTLDGTVAKVAYRYKSLIQAVNKSQGVANSAGVYAQTGINLASFTFDVSRIISNEIGNSLNLTGGFLSMYDGVAPVEQGFFLYPENLKATASATGGALSQQQYYYQVVYEWTDNQGNLFRSAPSIPLGLNLTVGGGVGSITLDIPTLRLTYKTSNPIRIVVYRWSTAQQNYYQVTSITTPLLNDTTVDSVQYVDTKADSAILGNSLIYTTGGVLEDIVPPATSNACLFNNRLFLVAAEDRNLLWFSKQVIESTPVEMSDLLTIYVAPSTASQGSTGPITAIAPMDDKLVVFKANALGYIAGSGPDNTGANSQYSDYTMINSVVGCTNQQSIVFTPNGLMFQSNKGIWLLGRDLSTQYIGAPVEALTTGALVKSALNIPSTNQVRFTLDSGITLVYDYYFGQWGTFTNVPAVSSTIYQSLHTYVNSLGQVFQETPGMYLDNTSPVLMSFTTGWMNFAGLQGYERFYEMLLLGQYLSPFKLNVQLAYNYNPSFRQATIVTPGITSSTWGSDALWGSGTAWGGEPNVFEARIFPQIQKCQSFQISVTELFDSSQNVAPGAGLTLSGLNLTTGIKRSRRTSSASKSFG